MKLFTFHCALHYVLLYMCTLTMLLVDWTEHPSPASYANSSRGFVHKFKSGLRTQTQVGASYARTQVGASYAHRTSQHPNTRETEHPSFTASNRRGFVRKLKSGLRTQTQVGALYAIFMSGSDFLGVDLKELQAEAHDDIADPPSLRPPRGAPLPEADADSINYPSVADDTGTLDRSSQHILSKMMNTICGKEEYPREMCAAPIITYHFEN